jgi:putative FmdB family regulatory protein
MPIYEYTCDNCSSRFEFLVRRDERPACPECGSRRLDKLLSVPAAHTTNGSSSSLPICDAPRGGTCGLPQCGMGGCQM